ncbi:hypothetical protein V3C99_005033 [Haemonchus contortus]
MSSSKDKGTCLVARAIPVKIANPAVMDICDGMAKLDFDDSFVQRKADKVANNINPSDFVALQSIRSSALARKTATTSKFCGGRPSLFEDLLNKDYDISKEKLDADSEENREEKSCDENGRNENTGEEKIDKGELLSRGPVKNARPSHGDRPYTIGKIQSGTAVQGSFHRCSPFSFCGSGSEYASNLRDTSDTFGYSSSSSPPDLAGLGQCYRSGSPDQKSLQKKLSRLLDSSQLPDPLVDFILEYSRRYTEQKTSGEIFSSPKHRPPSVDSGLESPLSARSASHASPEIPTGSNSDPATPPFNQVHPGPRKGSDRTAKHCLRALIPDDEMDDAWAWTLKCIQLAPDTLTYQDDDYDTLLHIVISHHDLAKIYSVVEQQLKLDTIKERPSFDVPNRYNETPLFLAVQQDLKEVVAYLLEVGADPNVQSLRTEREGALHYAAARGMHDIVEILCAGQKLRINELNGRGLTALHCAVINHGAISEHSMNVIDSRGIIITLLKAGADPTLTDPKSGRTVVHFAIETMDPRIVEVLKNNVEEDAWTDLVNLADFNQERPMDMFKSDRFLSHHDSARSEIFMTLLMSGAKIETT